MSFMNFKKKQKQKKARTAKNYTYQQVKVIIKREGLKKERIKYKQRNYR